jgi:hypothetical protein
MSSRVGISMPTSFSTALSSPGSGDLRSIQTAFAGRAVRSTLSTFFSDVAVGAYTYSMHTLRHGHDDDLMPERKSIRFLQVFRDGLTTEPIPRRRGGAMTDCRPAGHCECGHKVTGPCRFAHVAAGMLELRRLLRFKRAGGWQNPVVKSMRRAAAPDQDP